MGDFHFEVDQSVRLRNALVLTAFPSIGSVSTIAARFLVEVAGLKCIGGVYSPRLPPLASVNEGVPRPPIEVFAGERSCGVGGVCESLVVVTSDVPVPDEVAHDLAVAIVNWARSIGDGEIAILEGTKAEGEEAPQLFAVASSRNARERLAKHDVPFIRDGMIAGVSGVILHRGSAWGLDVYGLLVRANEETPDARAAAELVQAADRILIRAGFDTAAIEDRVAKVEMAVHARQREAARFGGDEDVAYL